MSRLAGGVRHRLHYPKAAEQLENPAAFAVAALKTVAEEAKETEAVTTAVTEPPSLPLSHGASIHELGAALEEQTYF